MRRDQIHKICLNHALTEETEYKLKDDKNWLFNAGDYSDGELEVRSFCVRFKNHEVAMEFKKAVDTALKDAGLLIENGHGSEEDREQNEDKRLAEKLSLPPTFYDYKIKDDCKGCRGCRDNYELPVSPGSPVLQDESPLPLELIPVKMSSKRRGSKPKRVSFSLEEPSAAGAVEKNTAKSTEVKPTAVDAKSIFSSALNTQHKPPVDGSSLFSGLSFGGAAPGKTIFGGSGSDPTPKSIFGSGAPLFGTASSDSSNSALFGGGSKTLFGTPVIAEVAPTFSSGSAPTFGAATTNKFPLVFGSASNAPTSIFGGQSKASTFSFASAAKDLDNNKNTSGSDETSPSQPPPPGDQNENPVVPDFLKADTGLSFASLASGTNANAFSASQNPNGGFFGLTKTEDVFTKLAKQKDGTGESPADGDDSNANDDNYDPHYEPVLKELPQEIQVSTGEEEEEKLFGERAKLYRYSNETKEWKERGEI